jgi:hypothetical protein
MSENSSNIRLPVVGSRFYREQLSKVEPSNKSGDCARDQEQKKHKVSALSIHHWQAWRSPGFFGELFYNGFVNPGPFRIRADPKSKEKCA